jgi:chloramphenicol-sensitive protein RarD
LNQTRAARNSPNESHLQGLGINGLLLLTGVSTAAPLIWFAEAARRLKLSTVGLLQYLSPTGQLILGVLAYGEPFSWSQGAAFGVIWVALVIYSISAFRSLEASRADTAPSGRG